MCLSLFETVYNLMVIAVGFNLLCYCTVNNTIPRVMQWLVLRASLLYLLLDLTQCLHI